jgi:hypothetical protein
VKRKKKGTPGTGIGPWQEHGAMARATRTKAKRDKRAQQDRRERQKGWDS